MGYLYGDNMAKNNVACLYTKHFFEQLYRYMLEGKLDTAIDTSNTIWHLVDVEEILVKNYGYRRVNGGGIM